MNANWVRVQQVYGALRFSRTRVIAVLGAYFLLTILGSLLEGVGLAAIVGIFTGKGILGGGESAHLAALLPDALNAPSSATAKVPILIAVFALLLVIRVGSLLCDAAISTLVRQRLQTAVFRSYVFGDWARMRDFRVGDAIGTATQEAMIVTKYLTSIIATGYSLLSALVLTVLAFAVNWKIMVILTVLALPLMGFMRWIFSVQALLSRKSAELRTQFSGDIAERLHGLLQVHVDGNADYHFEKGINAQTQTTRNELLIGTCQAVIGAFNVILPLTMLIALGLWVAVTGNGIEPYLGMIAAVGVISVRVAAQLNNAVVAVGNLSRLSGSLDSVLVALAIPTMQSRLDIAEPVVAITAEHIDYAYGNHHALKGISLTVTQGFPLVLRGRSGRGKTTLANVLAGIYSPMSGVVRYVGVSGKFYDSGRYRAKIGYVTQDVHLFCGSFRENLSAGRSCSDDEIWAELEQVDAAEFIRQLGGLDATMAEAGRSLSGGQRRRLGIARVLLARREILILDEITSGLDQLNREMIIQLIEKISLRHVVIIISHEYLPFAHAREYVLD